MSPIKILYVEDSEGDILLFESAIDESGINFTLDVVRSGNEAIRFLRKEKDYSNKKTPDIILLDINLPEMNGFEILDLIKADELLKQLPVFMFTTSSSQRDVLIAYKKYANSYFIKPTFGNDFDRLIKGIEYYWFNLATLPTQLN